MYVSLQFSYKILGPTHLVGNFLLILDGKVDKMIVFRADENRDGRLVEASALSVPFLDAVEGALSRQVKHEENGDGVVADQRQHIDKLSLAAQIPNRKGDFGIADRNGLLHKVDTQCLNVVFIPAAFDVFDHEGRLADLRVANHANFDYDVVSAVGRLSGALAMLAVRLV